ncbi:putative wiskott-Aldrich syndrome protein -like [Scophthalmus maximus]|uniref:Putative wiskott-Aldrich syndrome protein-like n=1 Tax=Scophthalmus maximus TaxID=52904 RepID=A0A2U9CZY9_SCOMX|nr:putative wiskott-Aldrich syndrome protein -like [Scophthalmus maximus]
MRGGRGMMKGFGPPGHGRGRVRGGAMNGFAPMRGMGRMCPYPNLRGHLEDDHLTHEAVACRPLDLHATSTRAAREATTMDRSLLRLTPHLAEARGGQGPLVADAFNTACP